MTPSSLTRQSDPHPEPSHSRALHVLLTLTTGGAAVVLAFYVLRPDALREGNPSWTDWLALVTVGLLPLQYWLLWAPVSLHARWKVRADAAEHSVSLALRTGGQCLWRTDAEGRVLAASGTSEQIFGYRPEELVGRCATDLLHPDDTERVAALLRSPMTSVEGWHELWTHCVTCTGEDRWVVSSGFPVHENGVFTGFEGSTWIGRGEREVQLRHQA